MKEFDNLTLLFIHRILCKRLDELMHSMNRARNMGDRGIADAFDRLAVLEAEFNALTKFRDLLVEEIALRDLLK